MSLMLSKEIFLSMDPADMYNSYVECFKEKKQLDDISAQLTNALQKLKNQESDITMLKNENEALKTVNKSLKKNHSDVIIDLDLKLIKLYKEIIEKNDLVQKQNDDTKVLKTKPRPINPLALIESKEKDSRCDS